MRRTATFLLAIMIALLFVCVAWRAEHPWLVWPRAFAEAGTVGAIADWYAVVALFRHPLGLPIPHTAIIRKNRHRIGGSLGNFVEENFLTPELVIGRLSDHNAAQALAGWLAEPANSRAIAEVVAASLRELLNGIDDADVGHFFDRMVIPKLRTLDVSRAVANILKVLSDGNRHQPLLDRALKVLENWLTANVDLIKARFSAASRFTPALLDAYIVSKLVEGVIALLRDVVATPDHELRREFDEAVQDLIVQLRTSTVHRRLGKSLMRDCIRHLRGGEHYLTLLRQVRARVAGDLDREDSALSGMAASVLVSLGESVRSEPAIQRKLNAWWLELAWTLVVRYRHQLSVLIAEVTRSWNGEEVSRKIEAEIGCDLQFIRINGTFVGGVVGVLLHAATLAVAR
ncbi:DUF445 domain-containing protein [Paraburkholderia fungorum]|nr:DUF445 domain-containing protein [Paraburkholderia fungorum]